MRHSRLFTYVFLLALLLLLAVPALAAAGGAPTITAADDTQSYSIVKLAAQTPQLGAEFGYSVSTFDNYLVVVGARYEDFGAYTNAGAVYVFNVDPDGHVYQMARLQAPDPSNGARFGQSVAVYGDTIVVGAPYDATKGDSAGAAYVFAGTGDRWNFEKKIYAGDAQKYDRFGDAVSTDGSAVLVGARGRYSNPADPSTNKTGAAYIFFRSGIDWSQYKELTDVNGGPYQEFGASVCITPDGSYLVGAPGDTAVTGDTTGKVCIWEYDTDTHAYTQRDDLSAPGLVAGDKFGSGLSSFYDYNQDTETYFVSLVANTAGNLGSWPGAPMAYEYVRDWNAIPWTAVRTATPADPGPMGAFSGSQASFSYLGGYIGFNNFVSSSLVNSGAVLWFGDPQDLTTGYKEPLTVAAPGVLANDFSIMFPFSGYSGWTATVASQPVHGDVTLAADGGFTYTPADGFWGTDTFTYTASAGEAPSNVATVTISVEEPATYDLAYAAGPGGTVQGDLDQTVHEGFDGTPVTAVADKHYSFVEWSDGLKTATRTDTDVTQDISVVAEFAPDRTEVALSAPIGYMKPAPGRWYTYAGTMGPRGKVGAHEVVVTVQRKVRGHWKTYRKITGETVKFSNAQTKYVISVNFKKTGAYRMRAKLDTDTQFGTSAFTFLRVNLKK